MKKIFTLVLTLFLTMGASAQHQQLKVSQLMDRSLYPSSPMKSIQFVPKTNKIVYVTDTVLYSVSSKGDQPLATLSQLNGWMKAGGFGSGSLRTFPAVKCVNEKEFQFKYKNGLLVCNVAEKNVERVVDFGTQRYDDLRHNDASHNYSFTSGSSLYVKAGSVEHAFEGQDNDIVFGQSVHRNEFGIDGGMFWSSKGRRLAFYRMDQSMVSDYPKVNTHTRVASSDPFKYPMAGMKSHEVTIGIFDALTGKTLYLDTRRDTSVAEREMYLTNLTWSPDENFLYVAKVNRDQNHLWLERYDAATGKLDKVLFEETNQRYVEPCEGLYFIPGNDNQFLWFSMRDGFKHLYLYQTDGTLLRQITTGAYEVEGVIGFDSKGKSVFVYANRDNLAGRAAYGVNLMNCKMYPLTSSEGTHTVVLNDDGSQLIDICTSVNTPRSVKWLDAKGKVLRNLYDAPNPLADYDMPGVTMGTIKAADGNTELYYRLMTPPNMEKDKKYPTLVYVYGGPHSQLVTDSWLAGANLYFTFLAQQGYVVFTLDNRGTDNRGFEFESCIHRNLGVVEMADQMEGVKFLQSLPYVDTSRMGVEGWSFGGFMTITMKLAHPEIFKVACAGGPVIDWKWYEVMYGERYMDTPQQNPRGYEQASLLDKAANLQGRLLVIHGAEDNTVVWQNSIEFVERCINNYKQVDYFVYPHHEHNVLGAERVHLFEKMFDYYETFLK